MSESDWSIIDEDIEQVIADRSLFEPYFDATILITGASGMIAGYLVDTILAANARYELGLRIVALVRNKERARNRFHRHHKNDSLTFLAQDVISPISSDFRFDFVIHAASAASPKQYCKYPVETIAANAQATDLLLRRCLDDKARQFLFISSAEIYGSIPGGNKVTENEFGSVDPMQLRACYAESKRLGETLCAAYVAQHGLCAKVVRPFHVYGPGMKLDDGRIFADLIADYLKGNVLKLDSDGSAVRAYCYLPDAVRGMLTVMVKGNSGIAYNIGNDDATMSVMELAQMIAGFREPKCRIESKAQSNTASKVSRIVPHTGELRSLGWRPLHSPTIGFRRTIKHYENNPTAVAGI